jgi:hypothetical protein
MEGPVAASSAGAGRSPVRPPAWGLAGVTLVTLAMGLAVVGSLLALQQAQAVTTRLVNQTQLRARQIHSAASSQIQMQSSAALWDVGRLLCLRRDVLVDGEIRWEWLPSVPTWFDGVFVWDGRSFRVLRSFSGIHAGAAGTIHPRNGRSRLAGDGIDG